MAKPSPTNDLKLKAKIKKHIKMNNFREIANELKSTDFEFTKNNRKEYSKEIKELIPTVNGNEELANIAKSLVYAVASSIGTESNKLCQEDRNVMARFLDIAATFVENQNPRYIKIENSDYMQLVNDSKIEELIVGRYSKMVKLESGEVVIYEINA